MNMPVAPMPNELLRLQKMHNGQKVKPTFSATEMQRRQDGLRKILVDMKLDAAVLTSYHNINYYSDFMFCYFGRKYAFVVTDKRAVSISAGIDAGQPWRRTFGDNVTYTDWRKDNYYFALQQELKGAKRVGIEFDHVSLEFNQALKDAFPGVEFVDIDTLLAEAHVVSVNLLLNDDTRGFLSAERIGKMRKGAILVNTARGVLVDEDAMIAALRSGHLRHAALDVFATEPLPAGHVLSTLPNVTLSAHSAFRTPEAGEKLLRMGMDIAGRL